MFGFSFGELMLICVVALVAVGPKKLPGMLQTLGQWLRKLRNLTVEMRNQTGIDELLRSEGLHGGLNELRGLLRGGHGLGFDPHPPAHPQPQPTPHAPPPDPYANIDIDVSREYPQEGADAYGALPDDLLDEDAPEISPELAALPSPEPAALPNPELAALPNPELAMPTTEGSAPPSGELARSVEPTLSSEPRSPSEPSEPA